MSYAGHNDLPAGHWVYVAPTWYIWKGSKQPKDAAAANKELIARIDPFSSMADKDVALSIFGNESIKGRILQDRPSHVLLGDPASKRKYWVNKAHVSYIQWDDEGK